jgi:hypothetical protein
LKVAATVLETVVGSVPEPVAVIVLIVETAPEFVTLKNPTPLLNIPEVRVPLVTVPVQSALADEQYVNVSSESDDVNWTESSDPRVVPRPAASFRTALTTTPAGFTPTGDVLRAERVTVATAPVVAKVAVADVSPAT